MCPWASLWGFLQQINICGKTPPDCVAPSGGSSNTEVQGKISAVWLTAFVTCWSLCLSLPFCGCHPLTPGFSFRGLSTRTEYKCFSKNHSGLLKQTETAGVHSITEWVATLFSDSAAYNGLFRLLSPYQL